MNQKEYDMTDNVFKVDFNKKSEEEQKDIEMAWQCACEIGNGTLEQMTNKALDKTPEITNISANALMYTILHGIYYVMQDPEATDKAIAHIQALAKKNLAEHNDDNNH